MSAYLQSAPPRVSIIIRTIGRPELSQAIESVCAQHHRPAEIILVNAACRRLPPLTAAGIPIHEVNRCRPLNRPEAANAGLLAATGEWLCFLDDDDYFQPDHLSSLLAALKTQPKARLAYSGMMLVHADGTPHARLNRPFDRAALYRGNYIQMGAALFCRSLVDEGVRFDESLLNFQDWDFWLQIAQRTDFLHTGKVTLNWRAFNGQSGSGIGPNADQALQANYTRRVQRKWAGGSGVAASADMLQAAGM